MFFEEDRILREIRRIAEVVARAVGLRTQVVEEEAESALGELWRGLFGLDRETTLMLDPRSFAGMVPPQHRDAVLVVLEQELRLLEAQGRDVDATRRRAQAEEVRRDA